jgi:hypothetical protein
MSKHSVRRTGSGLALLGIGLLGFTLVSQVAAATADLVPTLPSVPSPSVPSVSVPSLPVTLPTAPTTTTTSTPSSNGGGAGAAETTETGQRASAGSSAGVEGLIRLGSGASSIPAGSVISPQRLVISQVRFSPVAIHTRGQQLQAAFRVQDTRGYLVRGALVAVQSVPADRLRAVAARLTQVDGIVRFQLRTTPLLPLKRGTRLTIAVRAYVPGMPRGGETSALKLVSVRITP